MRTLALALAVLALICGPAAADPIYLRCTHVEPVEWKRMDLDYGGRYVILTIDLDRRVLTFADHTASGTFNRSFALTRLDQAMIKGTGLDPKNREQQLVIDRISGRTTLRFDFTESADTVWNDKKRQIGGFDLKPGEKLWGSASLDCRPTKPVLP